MLECRSCHSKETKKFLSLGPSPLANSFIKPEFEDKLEPFFSLDVFYCPKCHLVQLPTYETVENIFSDYAYLSSVSSSWLKHAQFYAQKMFLERKLSADSLVVEVASNDGYLLQYFIEKKIPVLGIEPAKNVAEIARQKGIPTEEVFFGKRQAEQLVQKYGFAELMVANNVLAHVPDIHDFISGFKLMLAKEGMATFEFHYLMSLIEKNQFDSICHEHLSYFSLSAVKGLFEAHELKITDVEKIEVHGGSLRLYVHHKSHLAEVRPAVENLLEQERKYGYCGFELFHSYALQVAKSKRNILQFFIDAKNKDLKVVGYGAPAKGNTLLNYCGIGKDMMDFTVDRNPTKQGRLLPGSRVPIYSIEKIFETKPDYIFILPWNLKEEIVGQFSQLWSWDCKFVMAIPEITIWQTGNKTIN